MPAYRLHHGRNSVKNATLTKQIIHQIASQITSIFPEAPPTALTQEFLDNDYPLYMPDTRLYHVGPGAAKNGG
ncbi:Uncharacterised protein [Escherichia coli]|uniref:Uncharacterized protein n=1 Tax=Escherichia coli TaxID=562 RepID=A0A2X1L4G0_ECOLX|nr:Uncharacterised protein [Escherichia coli]